MTATLSPLLDRDERDQATRAPGHGFKCERRFNRQFVINSLKCTRGKARIESEGGD